MYAVGLDGAGDVHHIFVDHGHKVGVVLCGQFAKELLERLNVFAAVVRRQGNAGEQNFDVGAFERGQNRVKVAPSLRQGKAAQAVVAAEFDDDRVGVQREE